MSIRFKRAAWAGSVLGTAMAVALGLPACTAAAAAGDAEPATSNAAVEQRVREALRVVMAQLVENGAFGEQAPQKIALAVDTPAQRVSDLGLLVDSGRGNPENGVRILAVTPGGAAERIGLRSGDVLLALNDVPLGGAASTLRQTLDGLPDGSALTFRVQRDGTERSLSGTLASVYVPAARLIVGDAAQAASGVAPAAASAAARDCARISDFDVAPRQQALHGAIIISIDGSLPGPHGATSFRVSPGPHVLQVAERIESRYLSFNDRLRNSSDRYKTLRVDAPPDTTTLVAARLIPDKVNNWQNGAYWEPVAWKQVAEACR